MSADLSSGSQSAGRSAGLTLNLSSNNPFRNRAASPNSGLSPGSASFSPPPHSPFDDPPQRPVSTNPFFDSTEKPQPSRVKSPEGMASSQENRKSPTAEELFDKMILDDRPAGKPPAGKPATRPAPPRGPPPRGPPGGPPRGENVPPRGRGPPPSHRPTRSQEEALRARRMQDRNGSIDDKKPVNSPQKRPSERRPRRNSESSIMDSDKTMTEEQKKAREARRREREKRAREGKSSGRPSRRLDLIDQLDATSIYGTGLFHHDGPFDALNPHRNRKGSRRAPMEAFPEGSLNNSLGGSGPLNAKPDHATFMGRHHDDEAFTDYRAGGRDAAGGLSELLPKKTEPAVWDPHGRASVVHGDESMGLGTSTFLEGTPAARTAIQRRQAETAQDTLEQGLQRKKSLAQRIRGINRTPREMGSNYGARSGELPSASSTGERNPFFNEFDKTDEERISVRQTDATPMSPGSPDSPPRGFGLERRATTDATNAGDGGAKPAGSGLLARVKSLKGGRRQRPEPPQAPPPTLIPVETPAGTAV
ncbi:Pal1 cell morphology protein-domain-containing protein [Xylariales sp. PMI_506]|nr:Pal1 cell morphology protein-domain-containing protein [Xylariales sp. PMI_506]